MPDWFGILLTILSVFIGGFALGVKFGEWNKVVISGCEKRIDCPLIKLPDHGDLIDKNRMIDVLHRGSKRVFELQKDAKDEKTISYCQGVMIGYANSIVALDGAPVVIPAERSEE